LQAIAVSGPARGAQITRIWAASVLIVWQARPERQGGQVSAMRPGNVAAGQDESTIVQFDEVPGSSCARLGAGHDDDGRGGDLFTLAGPDVLERQGFQAGLAVAVRSRVRSRTSMSGHLQLGEEAAGHGGGQRLARMSSMTPGGEFGPVQGGLTG
jgi:hypothetical protein